MLVLDNPAKDLKQGFVDSLLAIPLRIIWIDFTWSTPYSFNNYRTLVLKKGGPLPEKKRLPKWHNIMANGIDYSSSTCSLQNYCLNRFSITCRCTLDAHIISRRWSSRTNKIKGPSVKWAGGRQAM